MSANGNGNGHGPDDARRTAALEAARESFGEIRDGIEDIAALVDVVEEVGAAVIKAAHDGADAEGQFDAGLEALEPLGDDDNDALRVGLLWFIGACSDGLPEPEEKERPTRARAGSGRRTGRAKKARTRG